MFTTPNYFCFLYTFQIVVTQGGLAITVYRSVCLSVSPIRLSAAPSRYPQFISVPWELAMHIWSISVALYRGDFIPQEHLVTFGDMFGCRNYEVRGERLWAPSGQRPGMLINML